MPPLPSPILGWSALFLTLLCFSCLYGFIKCEHLPLLSCSPSFSQLIPSVSARPSSGISSSGGEHWALRSGYVSSPGLLWPWHHLPCRDVILNPPLAWDFPDSHSASHIFILGTCHILAVDTCVLSWNELLLSLFFQHSWGVLPKIFSLSKLVSLNHPILRDSFLPFKLK